MLLLKSFTTSFRRFLFSAVHPSKLRGILVGPRVKFHSHDLTISQPDMEIEVLPALQDNYMYLLIDKASNICAAVDPVDPGKIMSTLKEKNLKLTKVLTTHYHWDHSGGNKELVKLVPDVDVYGRDEKIPELKHRVEHNEKIKLGNLTIECLHTPCHTKNHICYYVTSDKEESAVFTGDTLFFGGCGRFFEGTPAQMYTALIQILAVLPPNTNVYCGHEYTVNNLLFAIHVEPENEDIRKKLAWAKEQRSHKKPTIPSTIGDELKINPFMRVNEKSLQKYTSLTDSIKIMEFIREKKNNFTR